MTEKTNKEMLNEIYEKLVSMDIRISFVKNKRRLSLYELCENCSSSKEEIDDYLNSHYNDFDVDKFNNWIPKKLLYYLNKEPFEKLNNKQDAKVFSHTYFNSLANWKFGKSHSDIQSVKYITKRGNVIECDSKSEIAFLEYIEKNNLALDIGGQSLCINYKTHFRTAKYYPDIVVYTKDKRIAIIEIKATANMSYHMNIEKYEQLKKYCKENGYLYMMIDPTNNISFDEMKYCSVQKELSELFKNMKKSIKGFMFEPLFVKQDVDKWYLDFGKKNGYSKTDFDYEVKSLIIFYDWYNVSKYGFEVYANPVKKSIG